MKIKGLAWLGSAILIAVFCSSGSGANQSKQINILTAEDVSFGESQESAMLTERPLMGSFVKRDSPVWNWVAHQFAGEFTGARYYWNGTPSDRWSQTLIACHLYPMSGRSGWVGVGSCDGDGYSVDGEQQWAALIFELFNIRNDEQFKKLTLSAISGEISKTVYVRKNIELEYRARRQQGLFYQEFWKSNAGSNSVRPKVRSIWYVSLPESMDDWLKSTDKTNVDFSFYGKFYDAEIKDKVHS